MKSRSNTRLWIGLAVVALAAAVVALVLLMRPPERKNDEPAAPEKLPIAADTYREVVSAFFTGVAALDADANDRAKAELARTVELVPAEPAGWMNLGLVSIRLGDDAAALRALEEARKLVPDNGRVDRLQGLLESRRGNSDAAVSHLRDAIRKDPTDVNAMFALSEEIERRGDPDAAVEAARLIDDIIKAAPQNLAVLLERARLAVKAEDSKALGDVVARLRPLAASWPERTQEQFRTLESAADEGATRQTATRVAVLRNLLVADPAFRASLAQVESPVGVVGEPIRRFLMLPSPSSTPSEPDTKIAFQVNDLDEPGTAKALIVIPAVAGSAASLLAADGREVRRLGGEELRLSFPEGTENAAPSPDGLLATDWNSDYAIDLVLAGAGGVRLFQQDGEGSFKDVTDATGVSNDVLNAPAAGAWAADIELDGDLDLMIGWQSKPISVLLNQGDGTFANQQPFGELAARTGFVWCDLDRDGLPDISFLDGQGGLHVFENQRSGRFAPRTLPDDLGESLSLTAGDLDGDGSIELVRLRPDGTVATLSDAEGGGWQASEIGRWEGRLSGGERLMLGDLDNNGSIDLIGTGRNGTRIWLGSGGGKFDLLELKVDIETFAIFDQSADGRLDLVGLSNERKAAIAAGSGTKEYRWQTINPRAAQVRGDGRINSFGLGGEIQVRSGLLVQSQVISSPTMHFGLGDHPEADLARIVWPNGTVQVEFDTKAGQVIAAEQRLKGSCPFVFAFDGSEMRFVTDFLWRSPLGLRINAQDTAGVAQTEDWIRISGDQLRPRNGYYDLRVTAELWETHYFDHMSLMVVDHPPGTEVFVDERFAKVPPTLKLHATGPLSPVTARDDTGRDVTDVVRAADGRYLDSFGPGTYQGVTRDHWIEVELGDDVPQGDGLRLIARGWVYPTDSSINMALSQGGHAPPQDLVLEVPTDDGNWKAVLPDLGFPAGKDKTVVLDLDGVFATGTRRRFRLRTNLEVYWDQLAVAVEHDDESFRIERIAPETAELRHRGYSRMTRVDRSSPERPDYGTLLGTTQRWRDLVGFYTRYGDVRELLERVDDRYIIANAGDEVALRFPEVPSPPDGWVRDFVLVGDGWNKDGDYNTAFSETVLPLPSHRRPAYDSPPGPLEDDPVYQEHAEDWEAYHTRYVTPEMFRNGLRPPGDGASVTRTKN